MAGIIAWLLILAVIVAGGWNTILWIYLGVTALIVIAAITGVAKLEKKNGAGNAVNRIEKLHYIDLDEYVCPKCGAKFWKNVMVCPKCGVRFDGTTVDDDEFIEEMEIWDDD